MHRAVRLVPLFATISLAFAGCAPGLGGALNVAAIPHMGVAAPSGASGVRVQVEPFNDARSDKAVGEIDGRRLPPRGDVGLAVQAAFQRYLRDLGADLAHFRAPVVHGEVREWFVKVKPAFPSTGMRARAAVDVSVTDPGGAVVYRASYAGEATAEDPFPSERKVEKLLGTAMGYAVKEAATDELLLDALSKVETSAPASAESFGGSFDGSTPRAAMDPDADPSHDPMSHTAEIVADSFKAQ